MKSHRSFACLFGIAAAFLCSPETARSQISEEEILALVAENQITAAQERVRAAYQKNPSSPATAYYRALFEENGEAAASSFQEFAKRFKSSEYAERASYRLGQYHFARGSYMRARQFLLEVASQNPQSPLAAASRYFAAKALLISGEAQPASEELQAVIQNSPGTWMAAFAAEDLARAPASAKAAQGEETKNNSEKENAAATPAEDLRYAVQAGAFIDKKKAQELEKRLKGSTYKTEVHERKDGARRYFLVWVGSFASREEAWNCAADLKKKYSVRSHVVRRDD